MIDALDGRLEQWIQSVLPKIPISLEAPQAAKPGKGISLYLVDVAADPTARGARRPPLRLELRYLVCAWAPDSEESHRLVGELAFAAMDRSDLQLEPGPVPLELWSALGVPPRAAFLLKTTVQKERVEKPVPRVRMALEVRKSLLGPLLGRVLGPKDLPLMGARVELPENGLSAQTDPEGRFVFPAVPQASGPRLLRVSAKGLTVDVKVARAPIVIRLKTLEV